MTVEILTELSQWERIQAEWEQLCAASSAATLFSHYAWLTCWWRHFGRENELAVALVRREGRLVGAAPLCVCTWEGFRHLGIVGSSNVDYEEFVVRDDENQQAVHRQIVGFLASQLRWDLLRLNKVPADSPTARLPTAALDSRTVATLVRQFSVAPFIRVSGSWEEYWQSRKSSFRRDTERQRRRLVADGHSVHTIRAETAADVERFFAALVSQHQHRRRIVKGDLSMFEDPRTTAFYRDVAETLRQAGNLDLQALEIDGVLTAVHLGFCHRRRYYYLVPTFDFAWASYSVGRLLLVDLIRHWWSDVDLFDLLRGDEAYKFQFATGEQKLVSVSLFRQSVRGRLAQLWFDRLRPRVQPAIVGSGLLPWLRRAGLHRRSA